MTQRTRTALAIVAGFIVNMAVVSIAEAVLGMIYPLPAGLDVNDRAQMAAHVQSLPAGAFAGLLIGWAAGAFSAAATAYLVSGRVRWLAWVGAGANLLGVAMSVALLPHPIWLAAIGLAAPIAAGFAVPALWGPARQAPGAA